VPPDYEVDSRCKCKCAKECPNGLTLDDHRYECFCEKHKKCPHYYEPIRKSVNASVIENVHIIMTLILRDADAPVV